MKKLLVLWDGDCGFCQQSLEWLKKQRLNGEIDFVSFHENKAKLWREKIGTENLAKSMYVIEDGDRVYHHADGVRLLLSRSKKWKWLSVLMGLPLIKQACYFGYCLIANNRYRLSKHNCKIKGSNKRGF